MRLEVRIPGLDEVEDFAALREQGYGFRPSERDEFLRWLDSGGLHDRLLGAYVGRELAGMLVVIGCGQFFGGRPIPMGGVANVVVAPEWRGRGIAPRLLESALAQMRARGEILSALGPATTWVYRKCGWELAGEFAVRGVPSGALAQLRGDDRQERRAREGDRDQIRRVYLSVASERPGMLARPAWMWRERLRAEPGRSCYVVETGGVVDGYVLYRQQRDAGRPGFALTVEEIAATSWDAEVVLWRHLASHGAQAERVDVMGMPLDALRLHLSEPRIETRYRETWMLRIVDAPGAIAARGFPPGLRLSIPLQIDDSFAPWNSGGYLFEVDEGAGRLVPGGAAAVRVDANGLASLFSGWSSARTLAAAGRLVGASTAQLSLLDAAFSGPRPAWNDPF